MIELKVEAGVARVSIARPEKANALDSVHLKQLSGVFGELQRRSELRAVVLAGRGSAFCGGADVRELGSLDETTAGAFVGRIHAVCEAIRALPVPVVAQLHGAVIGAGLEIAAACDLRIAADGTKFAMPEVRLGIPSVVEAALLPRLMGAGRAAWLVMTGEAIDARRAYEWGLVEEIGGEDAVERTVGSLLAGERGALQAQKALCQLWDEAPLRESIAKSLEAFARSYARGTPAALRKFAL
jgi:enoyl-CoA hydratase/carnithine racemase